MSPTKKRMTTPNTSSDNSSSESESESDGVPMAPAPAIAESSSESESESDGEPMAPPAPPIVGGLCDSSTNDDSDEEATKKDDSDEEEIKEDDSDEEGVKQAEAKKRERTEDSNGNGMHKGKKLKQTECSRGGGRGRGEEEDRNRKPLFQRLFTEKDEITLLQGIIDYTASRGDPFTRIADFYDYIKLSLQCDATEAQLHDKMKRMKKKYINISNRKGIKAGKEPNFTKHHERILFDLSKKIWPSSTANDNIIVDVDNTIKTDLEKKHKDLHIAQLTLFIEQTKLALKQAELALEAAAHST
ncbi:hypothetical protein ACFE04_028639 [Oxalis oulophora]